VRHDYLPYGEEIPSTMGLRPLIGGYGLPDSTSQRFSGKERDAESGLDYFGARYFSGAQGRFTSIDPVTAINFQQMGGEKARRRVENMLSNPQTWNMYSYALNNPLRFTDPNGEAVTSAEDVNEEITKRKLDEQRRELTKYATDLSKQVKEGRLDSKKAIEKFFSKAEALTKGTKTATENALILAAGSALDIRGSVGNSMTRSSLGQDTLHHFFVNAFNNYESSFGGLITFAANYIIGGGDPDPEDRNANSLGAAFGGDLRNLSGPPHRSIWHGEEMVGVPHDPIRPKAYIKPPPPERQ
jgi:RHS repeat-associated protein